MTGVLQTRIITKMTRIVYLCLGLGCLALFSCKKNQLGGKSVISGKVIHHAKAIPHAMVFIKFNAREFPGTDTTLYDEKVRADAAGKYTISCYKGDYYLYGFGYDYAIAPPYEVVGGVPVHIRNKEHLDVDVAVTEGD
jgi:hypothetical protein